MTPTYLRPWWKSLLLFLACSLVCVMASTASSMVLIGLSPVSKGTVFGDVPTWFVMAFALSVFSPVFGMVLYFGIVPRKYMTEFRKGLLPVWESDPGQVLFKARKDDDKKEPCWIENHVFQATVKVTGTQDLSTGHGYMTWIKLEDENGYKYLMTGQRFSELIGEMHDSVYTGLFTFDTTWVYPSIRKASQKDLSQRRMLEKA